MTYLSLFSGACGGDLACQHLLGWNCKGYVEIDDYCQRVIRQRIADGLLDDAPIFGDINAFIDQGYARSYQGLVDCITAGFPCQPFSCAGKQLGADDPRNMWPATRDCIRVVRPGRCLLENVPGLITSGYFGTILGDLAKSGYDARWRVLSAAELGAPHRRDRLWIVADASQVRCDTRRSEQPLRRVGQYCEAREDVANATSDIWGTSWDNGPKPSSGSRDVVANTNSTGQCESSLFEEQSRGSKAIGPGEVWEGCEMADTEHRGCEKGNSQRKGAASNMPYGQWATEPDVGRVANGVA